MEILGTRLEMGQEAVHVLAAATGNGLALAPARSCSCSSSGRADISWFTRSSWAGTTSRRVAAPPR